MIKKYLSTLILLGLLAIFATPFVASATGGTSTTIPTPSGFNVDVIMGNIITPLWQFFAGLAVIMFIVAGVLFVTSSGDPGKITTARNAFIWGVVGIIVAVVAFSIVQVVSGWI